MKKSKKGFTLIELVVVIAVLAILAAIAIPVVSGVIGDARANVDLANAKTIESAVKLYAANEGLTSIDAAGANTALTNAQIPTTIATQAVTENSFVINGTTFAVTIVATPSSGGLSSYSDVFVG